MYQKVETGTIVPVFCCLLYENTHQTHTQILHSGYLVGDTKNTLTKIDVFSYLSTRFLFFLEQSGV